MSYKRVLLKISGEALMGSQDFGHHLPTITSICNDVKKVYDSGIELCLVVGGGNIFRGEKLEAAGLERATGDYMGMLGTVINALCLQNILEKHGIPTRVLSAIPMTTVCEQYIRRRAVRHMEKKRVVIFAAGTGNPFFTTDTAATLRAIEMNCDAVFKGTKVDGVYSDDPAKNPNATKYTSLTFKEVLNKGLHVMDASAIALAMDNKLPIVVFPITKADAFPRAVAKEGDYTLIKD
jgi:uridylate kinase